MKVPPKVIEWVETRLKERKVIENSIQIFLTGVASALEVPEGYTFNYETMEFEPREVE